VRGSKREKRRRGETDRESRGGAAEGKSLVIPQESFGTAAIEERGKWTDTFLPMSTCGV
jgi:hypothetical protein